MSALAEVLVEHQGPEFIDGKGTVECLCGLVVDDDQRWAVHVVDKIREAGYTIYRDTRIDPPGYPD